MRALQSINRAGRVSTQHYSAAPRFRKTYGAMPVLQSRPGTHALLGDRVDSNQMPDNVDEELVRWAKEKVNAMLVDVDRINDNPHLTDTELARPWRKVLVPKRRIEDLKHTHYYYSGSSTMLWGIGPERPVVNCNRYDVKPWAIDSERMDSRPGKGPFQRVVRGAYGNRNFKYLWAIDHTGMKIAREMTPCWASSRGIITHSILVDQGVIGGEIFFDMHEHDKVYINFGSARLPITHIRQAEKTAEFILALGYQQVVAMIPDRDLRETPYGMHDRYGQHVENIVFTPEA